MSASDLLPQLMQNLRGPCPIYISGLANALTWGFPRQSAVPAGHLRRAVQSKMRLTALFLTWVYVSGLCLHVGRLNMGIDEVVRGHECIMRLLKQSQLYRPSYRSNSRLAHISSSFHTSTRQNNVTNKTTFWLSDEWLAELGKNIRLLEDSYDSPTQKDFWKRGSAHIRGFVDIDPFTVENCFQPETNGAPTQYLNANEEAFVLSVCSDDEDKISWQEQLDYLTNVLG
ncbi:hypothetical protein EV702DRAFT_1269917 [Suillus placidus]|uniref:Uncharacterized protein n=1 Tax=Suillus placidus TaxID=48579 RepID=A0A9P7D0W8_9AGAM|nr:hypothetical protein EV702DRAFT_1269917 [Suillus placidus]